MRGRMTNYLPYLNDAGVSCSIWTDSTRRPALVTRRRNTWEVRYTCRERRYPMSSCCCFNNSIAYLLLHRRLVRSNASSPPLGCAAQFRLRPPILQRQVELQAAKSTKPRNKRMGDFYRSGRDLTTVKTCHSFSYFGPIISIPATALVCEKNFDTEYQEESSRILA